MNREPGGTHAMPRDLVRRRPVGVASAPAPGCRPHVSRRPAGAGHSEPRLAPAARAAGCMTANRRWTLASRPAGKLAAGDFALVEETFTRPRLAAGEVLVRNRMFAVAPTIRNWLNRTRGKLPRIGCAWRDDPRHGRLRGGGIRRPTFPAGTRMIAMSGWEDWSVIRPGSAPIPVFPVPSGMCSRARWGRCR